MLTGVGGSALSMPGNVILAYVQPHNVIKIQNAAMIFYPISPSRWVYAVGLT